MLVVPLSYGVIELWKVFSLYKELRVFWRFNVKFGYVLLQGVIVEKTKAIFHGNLSS